MYRCDNIAQLPTIDEQYIRNKYRTDMQLELAITLVAQCLLERQLN